MNYYFVNQYPDELYHFGVKGMKWGIRKQRPVGNGLRRRSSWSQASQMARQANDQRRQAWKRSNVRNLSSQERRIRRKTRVAQGALIVAGTAMMTASAVWAAKNTNVGRKGVAAVSRMMVKARRYHHQNNTIRNYKRLNNSMYRRYGGDRQLVKRENADFRNLVRSVGRENPTYFDTVGRRIRR